MIAMLSPLAVFIMLFFIVVFCNFSSFFSGGGGGLVQQLFWPGGSVAWKYTLYLSITVRITCA